jgi:hypothetical protein
VTGLSFDSGRTAEQVLKCCKHGADGALSLKVIGQAGDLAHFADKLVDVNASSLTFRAFKRMPHRAKMSVHLRSGLLRLASRKTIAQFLKDGEG